MRFIGLDVHRDFCEVAISEDGEVRSAPRVSTTPPALRAFAEQLGPEDEVALENSSPARAVADILRPHVARVVVANPMAVQAIAHAKVKTDRIDAAMLARLLSAGMLPEINYGSEQTRSLRRRVARRGSLVKQRTAAKNEVHAVLHRNLVGAPPVADIFGRGGRAWLATLELPADEADTVAGCLRQIDLLSAEIDPVDVAIAQTALGSPQIRRLMTIPGLDVTTAAMLWAAIGDVRRFPTPKHLVSYLGLNPTVHQSGNAPAYHGRISKAGSSSARWALSEAAWAATKSPGPLRAFGLRIAARRGRNIAAIAIARKIAVLAWHMLTDERDYDFARPSLVAQKLRRLELRTGAPRRRKGQAPAIWPGPEQRTAERAVTEQAERAYQRLVADWRSTGSKSAGATTGARISAPKARSRAAGTSPDPALRSGVTRTRADRGTNRKEMSTQRT